jgi:hypothetical protein
MPVRSDHFWGFIGLMIVGAVLFEALPKSLHLIPGVIMLVGFGVLIRGIALGIHQTAQNNGGYGSCLLGIAKGFVVLLLICLVIGLLGKGCR